MPPLESMQNDPAGRPPPILFCPSCSCPTVPEAPPDAIKPKQQLLVRETRALVPAAKARVTATNVFMLTIK